MRLVQEAQRTAAVNGEHIYDAELLRLRARLHAAVGGSADLVVHDLEEAVRVAVRQGVRVFAVRSLLDLAERDVSGVWCADSFITLSTAVGWWEGRAGPPELNRAMQLLDPH